MNWAFAAAKRLVKNGVKFIVKNFRHFRASFPEERGAAKFHQKFHVIFHGDFHARFQDKVSQQHFCKACRDDTCISTCLYNIGSLRTVLYSKDASLQVHQGRDPNLG